MRNFSQYVLLKMLRVALLLFFLLSGFVGMAQIRLTKLVLEKHEKYFIKGADILVTDTLIMGDSSEIVLNPERKDNFIHSKTTIIGKGCIISGVGISAKRGVDGVAGVDQVGPCFLGRMGGNGSPGSSGQSANNLFLYLTDLKITGSLTINLNGGEGGDGGNGGRGGGGGPGTRVCAGGNGGDGGAGANGGNGGAGGTFSFQCKSCPLVRGLVNETLFIKNYGGFAGFGGEGGFGGSAGLGPINDGLNGRKGLNGKDGTEGKDGAIHFLSN